MFIIAISSYYLLKDRNKEFSKRSIMIASVVGVLAIFTSAWVGHQQGLLANKIQPAKITMVEALWSDEDKGDLILFALPNQTEHKNDFTIKIPGLLEYFQPGVLTYREVVERYEERIKNGLVAYKALRALKVNKDDVDSKIVFNQNVKDLGYALLMNKQRKDILNSTSDEIKMVAENSMPQSLSLFFSFRIMVGIGLILGVFFTIVYVKSLRDTYSEATILHKLSLWLLPLTWIAIQAGWFMAEYVRQPWIIQDILPTFKGASTLATSSVAMSLTGFILIYTALIIVDVFLMVKAIKNGSEALANK